MRSRWPAPGRVESASPLQVFELVGALNRHRVDYVLIGGVAMQAHGHVRTTQDLDVIAEWTIENVRRLAGALGELGARLRGVDADLLGIDLADPRQLYEGGNFLMRTEHGDLDVFAVDQTRGAPRSYAELRARAMPLEVRGLEVLVAHPEDLIRMKTAASRVRDRPEEKRRLDLDDITVLERQRTHQPSTPPRGGRSPTRGPFEGPESSRRAPRRGGPTIGR